MLFPFCLCAQYCFLLAPTRPDGFAPPNIVYSHTFKYIYILIDLAGFWKAFIILFVENKMLFIYTTKYLFWVCCAVCTDVHGVILGVYSYILCLCSVSVSRHNRIMQYCSGSNNTKAGCFRSMIQMLILLDFFPEPFLSTFTESRCMCVTFFSSSCHV